MKPWSSLCFGIVAGIATGCHAVAGIEDSFVLGNGGAAAGGQSHQNGGNGAGGAGGAGGETAACRVVGPPLRPEIGDPAEKLSFSVAIRSVDLGEDGPTIVGFDLDGRCTCGPEDIPNEEFPSSCLPSPFANMEDLCDAVGGVDGQSANLFHLLAASGLDSADMTFGAENGFWSVLLKVDDYGGGADDPLVSVTVFNALPREPPAWDGHDEYSVDPASLRDGVSIEQPKFVTETAYVREGRLVMSLDSSELFFRDPNGGYLKVKLTGSIVTAMVEESALGLTLNDAVLSGKWGAQDFFSALDDFRIEDGDPLCADDPLFSVASNLFCGLLDVNHGASNIAEYCDAMSFGISFETFPAVIGAAGTVPELPRGCANENLPSLHACDFL